MLQNILKVYLINYDFVREILSKSGKKFWDIEVRVKMIKGL